VTAALSQLEQLADRCPAGTASVDLADLHGYRYYTGPRLPPTSRAVRGRFCVVAAMTTSAEFSVARGLPRLFDRRSARGGAAGGPTPTPKAIAAPHGADPQLSALVAELRAQGQIVVRGAPGRIAEGNSSSIARFGASGRTGRWSRAGRSRAATENGGAGRWQATWS